MLSPHPTRITTGKCGWAVARPLVCLTCSNPAGAPCVQRAEREREPEKGFRAGWGQGVGANRAAGAGWEKTRGKKTRGACMVVADGGV